MSTFGFGIEFVKLLIVVFHCSTLGIHIESGIRISQSYRPLVDSERQTYFAVKETPCALTTTDALTSFWDTDLVGIYINVDSIVWNG